MTQTMGTLALGTLEMEVPHLFDGCPAFLFTWNHRDLTVIHRLLPEEEYSRELQTVSSF